MGRTMSDEDVKKAVAHAKAKEFGEEAGGQKQLLTIARAMLLDAPMLIID